MLRLKFVSGTTQEKTFVRVSVDESVHAKLIALLNKMRKRPNKNVGPTYVRSFSINDCGLNLNI